MKKLSLFLMALFVLASCSNDEYPDSQAKAKTQKVNFEVESSSFKLTSSSLKSSAIPSQYLLQYIFYNETGGVFLNKVLYAEDVAKIVTDTHVPLSIELPEGKYHVAIMSTIYSTVLNPELYIIKPENYHTDYYLKTISNIGLSNNQFVYYETFDLTVAENTSTQNVELKPMWSMIELVIENAKTFKVPAETEDLSLVLDTYYDGFYIESKLSKKTTPTVNISLLRMLEDVRKENTVSFSLPTSINEDKYITLKINYRKSQGTVIIDSQVIKTFQPENGKNYLISGNIGNTDDPQFPLNITLGKLDEEVIKIPY
ncbi:hypothetical protein CLV62_101360 [Dysgonomonas alginatilytica]|uniref:Fimbrillin-A associated anchor protein Mfa1/Mfa2 n=1 Tax=Dysgonomonas alginatilytica TaxID=1605892 RepID=A0A2V3PW72_9BACT|nr:hypothetical protein [Dysgonomonas alginatilytica]PXV69091.1 hypothetical protein CLV62_101360 [Dysgonomonas alginatilytica]